MDATLLLFYVFALLTVLSAGGIIFTGNLLHAAFLLMIAFMGIAGIFVLAGADFLAVTQVMIYIGGILVLILFGIMMTKNEASKENKKGNVSWRSLMLSMGFFGMLFFVIRKIDFANASWIVKAAEQQEVIRHSTVETLGINLLTHYLLPFEVAGILLLMALIGSVFVAGKVKFK